MWVYLLNHCAALSGIICIRFKLSKSQSQNCKLNNVSLWLNYTFFDTVGGWVGLCGCVCVWVGEWVGVCVCVCVGGSVGVGR